MEGDKLLRLIKIFATNSLIFFLFSVFHTFIEFGYISVKIIILWQIVNLVITAFVFLFGFVVDMVS